MNTDNYIQCHVFIDASDGREGTASVYSLRMRNKFARPGRPANQAPQHSCTRLRLHIEILLVKVVTTSTLRGVYLSNRTDLG